MKIFNASDIKDIDNFTILNEPITSIDLMERASMAVANWIKSRLPLREVKVFAGFGNNGGDALAVARILLQAGYHVKVFLIDAKKLSNDASINLARFEGSVIDLQTTKHLPKIGIDCIVIDGLFGSGLNRQLYELAAQLVEHLNSSGATIVSIDMPSGLMAQGDNSKKTSEIIKATYTLTFQFPKLSFLFPENSDFVGQWEILPIGLNPSAINSTPTSYYFVDKCLARQCMVKRPKFSHKGTFGHGLLIAGSIGKMGAALLATKACLRSGVGLITTHVPLCGLSIMQTALPEAMVSINNHHNFISEIPDLDPYNAIAIGPGIGQNKETIDALASLFVKANKKPIVIDADAINIIANNPELLNKLPKNSILTPHPKEFMRLAGQWKNDTERLELLKELAIKHQIIIVLKGAFTTIAMPNGDCYFNSTGNAGMATAGSGDVLTGIILGLLSQGLPPQESAILAVYVHGLAGDIYANSVSEPSLIASDIIDNLGFAFSRF